MSPFAQKIFEFIRMRNRLLIYCFFATQKNVAIEFSTSTLLPLSNHSITTTTFSNLSDVCCSPLDSTLASSGWNSNDMPVQQEPEVESSSFFNICLAQLLEIKKQGLKSWCTTAVKGAFDSKVIIIRFMSKFCPSQRLQTTMAGLALLMLSRKTYGIDPVWLSDFP